MTRERTRRRSQAEIAFDALSIEGSLLATEWLSKVAQLTAGFQTEADYGVPRGLTLRDEIGRYWRIAQAHWSDFQAGQGKETDPLSLSGHFVRNLLGEAFGFTSLQAVEQATVGERIYPVRLFALGNQVPIVVAPPGTGLDTPLPELGDGSRRRSAFGLLQEFLNASDDALWGLACDGYTLRLGRDNESLTRPAWIQADLRRIFTEQLYPDFAALWLLIHQSRFGRPNQPPEACPLEAWRTAGREQGVRARDKLRQGFEAALQLLGQGFVSHRSNVALRAALHDGTLSREDYFGELLRLVYRIIFLLAVEERGLLHPKGTSKPVRELYAGGYALARLRDRAIRRHAHDRHDDQWEAVKIVFSGLATGEPRLGLPALAGLFAPGQCPHLDAARLENRFLLGAIFHLAWLREPAGLTRVNWRDMGADELGYIYEGLLELVPQITGGGRSFEFARAGESQGHARKTTGSYYTPDELVQVLLDTALEPVIEKTIAAHPEDPAGALLELTVVDPAAGSGHFLLAAARRIAQHLAHLRVGGTPSADDYRRALREVIRRCIYGVDLNPLAVELCKVSLWMEAVEPGLPLTFLEAHIRHGNSLFGTTRNLMGDHVPDAAWVALEGDDRKLANSLRKRNKDERGGQLVLSAAMYETEEKLRAAMAELEAAPDGDAAALAKKEKQWRTLLSSELYVREKLVADAWCAAFVWPRDRPSPVTEVAPTTGIWRLLRAGPEHTPALLVETTKEIAQAYSFFHWDLAFPHVLARGGFDVVLGNPPWERVKLQEKEFFANRDPAIAGARNAAARKKLIAALPATDPTLWESWRKASRMAQGMSHFARHSGRYPLCGKGDINTYALFAEHNWQILGPRGRAGFIVPSGIATDNTTRDYFQAIIESGALRAMWEFENEGFFTAGRGHMLRFALTTLSGREDRAAAADFVFQGQAISDLDDPERHFTLSAEDIRTINPNTGTCPIFRTRRDAEIALAIYRRAGVLWREGDPDGNPWGLRFMRMFDMANDSTLFRQKAELASAGWVLKGNRFVKDGRVMLPLYEAKMAYMYNHRAGSFEGAPPGERPHRLPTPTDAQLADPNYVPQPFYWVDKQEVDTKLDGAWNRGWLLGWRDVTDARASIRTVVSCIIPRYAVNDKFLLMMPSAIPLLTMALYANLLCFPLDYAARQKVGGLSLKYFTMRQLPVFAPSIYGSCAPWAPGLTICDWLLPRVLELTYTAWDLKPFAEDCGDDGPPFIWDAGRRFQLRCEIDAAFFHLYGLSRDDTAYILDTFDVLERKEVRAFGEFRTRRVILETYDALAEAIAGGRPYVSPLGPPRRGCRC